MGKGYRTIQEYYFSVRPEGQILALTLENLKQALPNNHKFHDSLDATVALSFWNYGIARGISWDSAYWRQPIEATRQQDRDMPYSRGPAQ
jgi:hypothetical protein